MLARTASNLFWLARYMERADYLARLLEAAAQMNSVNVNDAGNSEWESALVAAGAHEAFMASHDVADEAAVIDFLAFDMENPSSIASCIENSRRNARAVRTALTAEMWDAINVTWQELVAHRSAARDSDAFNALTDWVKARVSLFQGASSNGMLRLDSFHFHRLGRHLERADNIARLLDVKYHVRLPTVSDVGGVVDYYQWVAILRVVGARRAYRVLFKGQVEPAHVAELLISRTEFPRSLAFSYREIVESLDAIKEQNEAATLDCKRLAHETYASLRYADIDAVIGQGLHEYLTDVVRRTDRLGASIAKGYLF